jgi:hypothetical protein
MNQGVLQERWRREMSNLVHNERTKLWATFLNNIGVASIAVGGFLRLLSASESNPVSVVIVFSCVFLGFILFGMAYATLNQLKE